jgi:hypothetical protein
VHATQYPPQSNGAATEIRHSLKFEAQMRPNLYRYLSYNLNPILLDVLYHVQAYNTFSALKRVARYATAEEQKMCFTLFHPYFQALSATFSNP